MSEAELLASMEALRGQLAVSRRRELMWRVFVLIVLVVGIWLVIGVKHSNDQIVSARSEARSATCRSDNTFIANHDALVDAVEKSVAQINVPNPARTVQQQADLDKFIAEYVATIDKSRVPLRDCSPAAITAFYKGDNP